MLNVGREFVVDIIPRVLTSLIRELDDRTARVLSLEFAERAIQVCAGALSIPERDSSLAYIAAARGLLEGTGTISELDNAHHAYFSERNQNTGLSDGLTWVAATAVKACCQRQMEDAGILIKVRYIPGLLSVAKAAQAVAGRCAAASDGKPKDSHASAAAQRARWLEAKWQLLYLIESVPFPGDRRSGNLVLQQ